jgi:hypothetical protein
MQLKCRNESQAPEVHGAKALRDARAVSKTSILIASLPSAIRLVRFFHVDGAEPTRRPTQ